MQLAKQLSRQGSSAKNTLLQLSTRIRVLRFHFRNQPGRNSLPTSRLFYFEI